MLALYHNAASTCSQKVRLVLAEKGLEYESRDVDLIGGGQHDDAYVKLNANHVVPTLVHDDHVLIESTAINEYLDDAFAQPPLRPADPVGRHAMRVWTQRIDVLHPSAGVLTFGIGARPLLVSRGEEAIAEALAQIPDPRYRENRRVVIEQGIEAPIMQEHLRSFLKLLDQMQQGLEGRPWLAGDSFSLADAAALPYVLRLDHLAMTPFIEARSNVSSWYARVRERESFRIAVGEMLPQLVIDLFRKNGEEAWARVQELVG